MGWNDSFLGKDNWATPLWQRGAFKFGLRSPPSLHLEEDEQGFVLQAASLQTLFTDAASTLFSRVAEKTSATGIKTLDSRTVEVTATSPTELLINWLNVLLVLFHRQGMVCTEYNVIDIDERHLEVEVSGEEYNPRCHTLHLMIKRVLADKIRLQKAHGLWQAVVVYEPEPPFQITADAP